MTCVWQARSRRNSTLNAAGTVRPTTSSPWLRRIMASLSPRSLHQPLALVDIVGDAFEIVIGDVEKPHRRLRQRQQPAFHRRDGHAGRRVRMRHAVHVVLGHVDGAVNDEAGNVDVVVGCVEQRVALDIHLDQAGGVDFLVEHAVGD